MTAIASRPSEVADQLEAVLDLRDPIGVLSIYVDADPSLTGGARPAWQAPVRDGIRRLRDEAREWPRERRFALEERLDALAHELELLLDPRGAGRGRALFAAVSSGETVQVELRTPLPTLVQFDGWARALPLVQALGEGRPAGVALVRRGRIEVLVWKPRGLESLCDIELAEPDPEGRGSPGGTNPAVRQPGPERDRFERVHEVRLAASVRASGEQVRMLANERGWDVVVCDGDPRLASQLEPSFAGGSCELVRSPVPLATLADAEVAARVEPIVRGVRAQRHARLTRLLETSPLVTRGARAVSIALDQGRVDHLLLDPFVPAAAERLLRGALATSSGVTVTPTPAGAAALLRW